MTDQLNRSAPVPFTADDFAARRRRTARAGQDAGFAGLLLTPGPDLVYLTGYAPVAITERITMLVIPADRRADDARSPTGTARRGGRRRCLDPSAGGLDRRQ